jgi:Domain of unknown function (DUF2019)
MTTNALVREFADCVVWQSRAVAKGDARTGNKYAKRYITAFNELRASGDEGRNALAALLSDERAEVRVMAAAFLLRHCGQKAIAVLESEAKGTGPTAFGAAQALARWKDGTWALDPK